MERRERNILLFISLSGLLLFYLLSNLVATDYFRDLDYEVMDRMQKALHPVVDKPFSYITLFGSTEIISVVILSIFIYRFLKSRHIFLGLLLYVLIFIMETSGKLLIFHPDPPKFFSRYSLDFHFPSSYIVHTNFSYPSGHMARTVFIFTLLFFFLTKNRIKKIYKIGLLSVGLFYILLVFISRIYLGEHWLSDVLGGTILGSSIALLSLSFW